MIASAGDGAIPAPSSAPASAPRFNRAAYNPAVLHVRFTAAEGRTTSELYDAFLDLTLVPSEGEVDGLRVEVSRREFAQQLKALYGQLSRQGDLRVSDPSSASRRLYQLLLEGLEPLLEKHGVTTLLVAADRGLQAVPFAALSDGEQFFGNRYGLALTPSLAMTDLSAAGEQEGDRLLALGASEFDGLASLPFVPQELQQVGTRSGKDEYLNREFTPQVLLKEGGNPAYNKVHVATHADFKPGGPEKARLYTGERAISMQELSKLREGRGGVPLDLIVFSACRTALGDPESELGFAGLALQAGARSAIGTLWYVDDVVTSAYFVQMYRYLEEGIPKAEAMQLTRQAFSRGLVSIEGDEVIGVNGSPLITGLSEHQGRQLKGRLTHPYFWSGIQLMGAPW